ncbi:MAG: hypothetical protein JXR39_12365 [Marinilabiliaceae bacterium]|nr:hypothetical protein [Marinilabiliaceae bacterium]
MTSILKIKSEQKLTKQQEEFNKLVALIEKRKKELERLHQNIRKATQIISEHLIPLEMEFGKLTKRYVVTLHGWLNEPKITKSEREKIIRTIDNHLSAALAAFPDDKELLDIAEFLESQDVESDDESEAFHEMFEQMFEGIFDETFNEPPKKKTKQQQKKEAERQQAAQADTSRLEKITKKLYTDLVKKLHPDREHDDTLRAEKTEIMKEVTLAYNDNNIHALMHLHLAHMDDQQQSMLSQMADEQIKSYVKLLKQQSIQLQGEINSIKYRPETQMLHLLTCGTEVMQKNKLKREIESLKLRNHLFEESTIDAFKDLKALKKHLKTIPDVDEMLQYPDFF